MVEQTRVGCGKEGEKQPDIKRGDGQYKDKEMADRESNIALNLADDDEPTVQAQENDEQNHTDQAASEGVENSDGSVTEYATPPAPDGDESAQNVPESPFAAEIAQFRDEIAHPEDFSDAQLKAVGISRLHPDLSNGEISERMDHSSTTVGKALRKADMATLSGQEEIHEAFQNRTDTQQGIIATAVSAPDKSDREVAEIVGCGKSTAKPVRRKFMPLVRKLRDTGFPNGYSPPSDRLNENSLEAEIAAFKEQVDHPDAYSDGEIEIIALAETMGEEADVSKIENQTGKSRTLVSQALRKREFGEITDQEKIHEKYHDLTETQQQAVKVAISHPNTPISGFEDLVDADPNTIQSYQSVFKPLIVKLQEVGLPDETDMINRDVESTDTTGMYECKTCGKSFETRNAMNGHMAVHDDSASEEDGTSEEVVGGVEEDTTTSASIPSSESASDNRREESEIQRRASDIETVRQFVTSLRVTADRESSASESGDIRESAVARKATCDAVIDFIDSLSSSETR